MASNIAIGIGAPVPLPYLYDTPPTDTPNAGFYPLKVNRKNYAEDFFLRGWQLQYGRSQLLVSDGGSAIPQPFNRQIAINPDPRYTIAFPGACNFLDFDNSSNEYLIDGGELHIGWNGTTPIFPPDSGSPSVPTGNEWPTEQQTTLRFDPFDLGTPILDAFDLNCAYYDGANVYPFIWSWFYAVAPGAVSATAYLTNPYTTLPPDLEMRAAGISLRIFDWGLVPLYCVFFKDRGGPVGVATDNGLIEVHIPDSGKYAY